MPCCTWKVVVPGDCSFLKESRSANPKVGNSLGALLGATLRVGAEDGTRDLVGDAVGIGVGAVLGTTEDVGAGDTVGALVILAFR